MEAGVKTLTIVAVMAVAATFSREATAQGTPRMTQRECETAATALSNRAPASQWERIGWCGSFGAQTLARALIAARLSTDTAFLSDLAWSARLVRDVGLLQTAMQLAEDSTATTAARVVGLLTVVAQYAAGIAPRGRTFAQLVSVPVGWCWMSNPFHSSYTSDLGVALSDRQSAAMRSATLGLTPSVDPVIRDLASCVSDYVAFDAPPSVDPQLITLDYVCGSKFRVRNAGVKSVRVSYLGFGAQDGGGLYVPANSEAFVIARCECALDLFYQGRLIRSAPNAGTTC